MRNEIQKIVFYDSLLFWELSVNDSAFAIVTDVNLPV